jgi:hypothetical protein
MERVQIESAPLGSSRQDRLQRGEKVLLAPFKISYREKQLILLEEVDSLWHCTGTFRAR